MVAPSRRISRNRLLSARAGTLDELDATLKPFIAEAADFFRRVVTETASHRPAGRHAQLVEPALIRLVLTHIASAPVRKEILSKFTFPMGYEAALKPIGRKKS
jgi:hypothetical protein